jgi:hypothetical protein
LLVFHQATAGLLDCWTADPLRSRISDIKDGKGLVIGWDTDCPHLTAQEMRPWRLKTTIFVQLQHFCFKGDFQGEENFLRVV